MGRFKYLGILLEHSDKDWSAVLHYIRKSSQVWGRLHKILQREGAEPIASGKFYRAVVQSVILLGANTWVLTEAMIQQLEGLHMIFFIQVTRRQETRQRYGSWQQVPSEAVLQGSGKQTLRTYVAS